MLSVHQNRVLAGTIKVVLGAAVSLAATAAFAQTVEPKATELEEVVVTGYRASLEKALDQKRENVGAVDAIVAEDIAKFPDNNLAESIQRIPGVSISRDAGEGREISVRGLGAQFTRVRINGMEALSTTGSTDASGGTNRDRSFDFNVFASELFNQVLVRKTASAEIEEGSLGATVDLRAGHPFDYKGFTVAGSAQGVYDDLSQQTDPRAALLISDLFADGRFGVLVSGAYTKRRLSDEGSSTVRWQPPVGASSEFSATSTIPSAQLAQINCVATAAPQACTPVFYPRLPRYDKYIHEQERTGITGSMQWKPVEGALFTFDALYAKFDATRREQFLEAPSFSTSGAVGIGSTQITAADIDSHNSLVYGVFNNVDIRSEARFDQLSTVFKQYTLDGSWQFTDRLTGHVMAGTSDSNHQNPIQTTITLDDNNIADYSYDFRNSSRLPVISYGSVDVTNPSSWTVSGIRLRPQTAENKYKNALADLAFKLNDTFTMKGGLQVKTYEFDTTELRRTNGTTASQEGVVPANVAATPISSYSELTTFGHNLDVPPGTPTTWLIPNLDTAASLFNLYDPNTFPLGATPALGNNRSVHEQDNGAYAQMDMNTLLLGHRLRSNLGIRYVKTRQVATGYTYVSGGPVQTTVEHDYSDTLPSLNAAWDLRNDFVVRLGVSKVMSRPNLGSLNPGSNVSISGNSFTVAVGNPNLDPYRAMSYDLSFEWYFAKDSLLSFALFDKEISTFVQTVRETRPFTGNPYGLPDSVAIAACGAAPGCTPDATWNFDAAANTPGGGLHGFEFNYQQAFTFLPSFWSNFGAIFNYTWVDSKVKYVNSSGVVIVEQDITNLSKQAFNATLYFENNKFSARISGAYRSPYLTTVPGRNDPNVNDPNNVEGTASTLNLDFSSSWKFNDHFELSFEGLNLTDQFQDQWINQSANRLSYYHHTGREFLLGARVKF